MEDWMEKSRIPGLIIEIDPFREEIHGVMLFRTYIVLPSVESFTRIVEYSLNCLTVPWFPPFLHLLVSTGG